MSAPDTNVRYTIMFGPDEEDWYTAMKVEEHPDGSLTWWDTAGIPREAKQGHWFKELKANDKEGAL